MVFVIIFLALNFASCIDATIYIDKFQNIGDGNVKSSSTVRNALSCSRKCMSKHCLGFEVNDTSSFCDIMHFDLASTTQDNNVRFLANRTCDVISLRTSLYSTGATHTK